MRATTRTVEEYLRSPYSIVVRQYEDGTYFAEVAELPGCMTEADTAEEALEMIRDAMAGWIEVALSEGLPMPEPGAEAQFSGRFLVRAPKTLHRDLVRRARAEGSSLNQFVVTTLGRAIGGADVRHTLARAPAAKRGTSVGACRAHGVRGTLKAGAGGMGTRKTGRRSG